MGWIWEVFGPTHCSLWLLVLLQPTCQHGQHGPDMEKPAVTSSNPLMDFRPKSSNVYVYLFEKVRADTKMPFFANYDSFAILAMFLDSHLYIGRPQQHVQPNQPNSPFSFYAHLA